jgi:hypothetical protein
MRRISVVVFLIVFATSAFAVSGNEVMYVAGSVSALKAGEIGTFDVSPPKGLVFIGSADKLSIPYDGIKRVEYRREVAHHLGVAPAIVVGLVKRRERKHFLTVTYVDEAGEQQAGVFEVSKQAPQGLLAILAARAPKAYVRCDQNQK